MTQPLGSTPITKLRRYYGLLRPCAPRRYSPPCGTTTWSSPFTSERQVPTFRTGAWTTFTPPQRRAPPRPSAGPSWAHPGQRLLPVSTPSLGFRRFFERFAFARLRGPHLTRHARLFPERFSPRLLIATTPRRFEACSCKPAPRGPPSSPVQRGAFSWPSRPPFCAVVAHYRPPNGSTRSLSIPCSGSPLEPVAACDLPH